MLIAFLSLEIGNKMFKGIPDSYCPVWCANRRKGKSSVKFFRIPSEKRFSERRNCGLQPSKGKNGQIRLLTQQNYVAGVLIQVIFV